MKIRKICLILMIMFVLLFVGCKNNNQNNNNNNNNNNNQNNVEINLSISTKDNQYYVNDNIIVDLDINEIEYINDIELCVKEDSYDVYIVNNVIVPNHEGTLTVYAKVNNVKSNEITLNVKESIYDANTYANTSKEDFYVNYEESINYYDTYYRSQKGFMSGDIDLPDQEPILSNNQPKEDGKFVKNTNTYYSVDKKAYYITDCYGEIVDVIFKDGGYISLDEVASYLLAFGDTPANHDDSKKASPSASIWKEYLRCNQSQFSGSTTKYPYEPMLPRISGCGGDLYYYEVDFGTTGTDCDPGYAVEVYNNGSKITRGAARLVYAKFDSNKKPIEDVEAKFVFYTYNHYNDFQEYLNYQGGWGEMFGNITGGGELSSKYNYNPTPYVEVVKKDFSESLITKSTSVILCDIILLKKENNSLFN